LKGLSLAQGGNIVCQLHHALNQVYCEVATVKDKPLSGFTDSLEKVGVTPPPGYKAAGIFLTPVQFLNQTRPDCTCTIGGNSSMKQNRSQEWQRVLAANNILKGV
jgi:hypothetical protein